MKYVQEPGQFFRYPRYVQVGQLCFLGGGGWGFVQARYIFYVLVQYECLIAIVDTVNNELSPKKNYSFVVLPYGTFH